MDDISGKIHISRGDGFSVRQFKSKSPFFRRKGNVIIKEYDGYFTIRYATLMDTCKTNKLTKNESNWFSVSNSSELEVGVYEIDTEESNEDIIYVYY